jgi:hypothetical protein
VGAFALIGPPVALAGASTTSASAPIFTVTLVPNAVCPAAQDNITADQRGFPRPAVATDLCDGGAVEVAAAGTPSAPATTPAIVVPPRFTG